MAALVERDHAVAVGERLGRVVGLPGVAGEAVEDEHRRRVAAAPLEEVEAPPVDAHELRTRLDHRPLLSGRSRRDPVQPAVTPRSLDRIGTVDVRAVVGRHEREQRGDVLRLTHPPVPGVRRPSSSKSTSDGISNAAVMPELMPAGAIALTRIDVFTNSIANERVIWTTAPFVMQYTTV